MKEIGFDNGKYLETQSQEILKRIDSFGGKLYLEFGGKLYDDYHASRVLPGFMPDSKLRMLLELKDKAEVIVVINAMDIEKNKMRADYGITYDKDVLRIIDVFRKIGLFVGSIVVSHFSGQSSAVSFIERMKGLGIKVYRHYIIPGYPTNIPLIVSDEGFGKNDYIETERELVVVTAPGPGSGKMATCLSQLYHENKRGIKAGYAKFETFPIWNLPLNHPVNMAYEAATADLNDVNMIDPFHLQARNELAVNYNRDVEVFPVLKAMFEMIFGESPYASPTEMGVNMAGSCITDDEVVCEAAKQEIIRRYYTALCDLVDAKCSKEIIYKLEMLMHKAGLEKTDRPPVKYALLRAAATGEPAAAIQLDDGEMITGKTSPLLGCVSAMMLNALKHYAGIDKSEHIISREVIEPIQRLKTEHFGSKNPRLHLDELLIALSICAATDEKAASAVAQLDRLRDCELHSSVILSHVDMHTLKKLGVNVTCEPEYEDKKFYK